jgi:hypothetical protein
MKKSTIRHNLAFVKASDIAGQFYCEKAVDLRYRYPGLDLELPAADFGTIGHDIIAQEAERISNEELKERIEAGKATVLKEWPFESTYRKVQIKGVPDHVEIKGRDAGLLVEFKFSKKKHMFKSYRVQLNTYAFLLHKNRFDVANLICGAVVFPLSELDLGTDHKVIIQRMKKSLAELRTRKTDRIYFEYLDAFCYLYPFSLAEAKGDINWALEYWLKERNPKGTSKAYKCRACPYSLEGLCKVAINQ